MRNQSPILKCCCSLLCFICSMGTLNMGNAKEINTETALSLISSKEKAISSMRWQCRSQFPSKGAMGGISQVALDLEGRFRIVIQEVALASADKGKTFGTLGVSEIRTFDGGICREQKQQQSGNTLPGDKSIAFGTIKKGKGKDTTDQAMTTDGIRYFFPYFFPLGDEENAKTLSEYLRYKLRLGLPVRVNEDDRGVWEITTVDKDIQMPGSTESFRYYAHVKYDPGKGKAGAVLLVIVSSYEAFADAMIHKAGDWDEISYDVQENSGFWIPRSVRLRMACLVPASRLRLNTHIRTSKSTGL